MTETQEMAGLGSVRAAGSAARRSTWKRRDAGVALLLLVAVLAGHGWSVDDGLSLDDHWHYETVRSCGWSWSELLEATTIDGGELAQMWWQETPVRFQYARPVAVALLKATYAVTGGSVLAPHIVSLVLHLLASLLVYRLCLLLSRSRPWSVVGALAFVWYPLSLFAVSWLAAQNMVLVTVLMLGALLCYVRASGLRLDGEGTIAAARLDRRAVVAVLVLWVAALFSRENAIMLPGVLVALDMSYGGWRHVRARMGVYALFALIGIGFCVWRLVLHYEPMPDVYVRRPDGSGYVLWAVAKLLHYVCCAVFPAPMTIGPTGRYHPFSEAPWDCALMIGIIAIVGAVYWRAARSARGYWIWPLWVIFAVLPVVPVLATPHSGYLCGVGVVVGIVVALAGKEGRNGRITRGRVAAAVAILVLYAGSVKAGQLMWKSIVYGETFTVEGMRYDPPPPETTDVFAINLPFSAVYAKRCLVESHGPAMEQFNWHVLTFAPHLLRMEQPCTIERTGDRTLTIRVEGRPYFSGVLGRFLTAGFGRTGRFETGETFAGDLYEVSIEQANEEGVQALRFTFTEPLDSPKYCFYVTSKNCGAMRLRFGQDDEVAAGDASLEKPTSAEVLQAIKRVRGGDPAGGDVLCAALPGGDETVADRRAAIGMLFAVAETLAAPEQYLLASEEVAAVNAERIAWWWRADVDEHVLLAIFHDEAKRRDLRHRRDEVKRARKLVSRFLRTDLYLTGPPFPGPR